MYFDEKRDFTMAKAYCITMKVILEIYSKNISEKNKIIFTEKINNL